MPTHPLTVLSPQDIKPGNAVFTRDGSIRLIDFSVSLDKASGTEEPCCQVRACVPGQRYSRPVF